MQAQRLNFHLVPEELARGIRMAATVRGLSMRHYALLRLYAAVDSDLPFDWRYQSERGKEAEIIPRIPSWPKAKRERELKRKAKAVAKVKADGILTGPPSTAETPEPGPRIVVANPPPFSSPLTSARCCPQCLSDINVILQGGAFQCLSCRVNF